jgi:cytochrome c oxidase subunit 1
VLPVAGIILTASSSPRRLPAPAEAYAPLPPTPFGQMLHIAFSWAASDRHRPGSRAIVTMRAPGMSFWRMPPGWVTSTSLLVVRTPFIAGSQFLTLFDRVMGTDFFNPLGGGDVIMYQHVFWFYSHPAVYIMMLPGFDISEVSR